MSRLRAMRRGWRPCWPAPPRGYPSPEGWTRRSVRPQTSAHWRIRPGSACGRSRSRRGSAARFPCAGRSFPRCGPGPRRAAARGIYPRRELWAERSLPASCRSGDGYGPFQARFTPPGRLQLTDWTMKAIRYTIYAIVGLLVLLAGAAAVFVMTFDPNRYKGQIEQLVKDKTGRTLDLKGKLEVAIWPSLGAMVAGLTLSERDGKEHVVAEASAHVYARHLPLLHGPPVVAKNHLSGLKVRV